jgi:hypothetical protein
LKRWVPKTAPARHRRDRPEPCDTKATAYSTGRFGVTGWPCPTGGTQPGYVPEAERSSAETLEVGDRPALWIEAWPIAEVSTLVLDYGGRQLVVEIGGQGDFTPDKVRPFAEQFAANALEHLS